MARKITLVPGLEDITGVISRHKWKDRDGIHVRTTRICKTPSGKRTIRIYNSDDYKRTTPVSEKELENRRIFAETGKRYKQLTPQEKEWFEVKFISYKGKFKGKKYSTLHGFIKAWLYADIKDGIN